MYRLTNTALAALLIIGAVATSAQAIIRRHDIPDERYLAFGSQFRDSVGIVRASRPSDTTGGSYIGTGTLINDRWVLTAAHSVREGTATFQLGENRVKVAQIVLNPKWDFDAADAPAQDIALLRLEKPLPQRGISCLYSGKREPGKVATLVGFGYPGDGISGPSSTWDKKLRASTVRVDKASAAMLAWRFRGPGDPLTTPMEGISGPADSGGPALLKVKGKWCVAGVSSTQDDPDKVGEGKYGVVEQYARVSFHKKWIEDVIRKSTL